MNKARPWTALQPQDTDRDSVDSDSGVYSKSAFSDVLFRSHQTLSTQFERLTRYARTDQQDLARSQFGRLDSELRSRMAEEEELLIRPFAQHAPVHAQRLWDDHERLRELLDGLASQLGSTGLDSIHLMSLAAALRAHADQEALLLYPWVDRSLSLRCKMSILEHAQARRVGQEDD